MFIEANDVLSVWSFKTGRIKPRWLLFYPFTTLLSLSGGIQVLQKLEAKWVKDRCRELMLLVACGRVQYVCEVARLKTVCGVNHKMFSWILLFTYKHWLLSTYSLEYAVVSLMCYMLIFFTLIDYVSSGSVIQSFNVCTSQVHFHGAQLFLFCSKQLLVQIINIHAASSFNSWQL